MKPREEKPKKERVHCSLCPNSCVLAEGQVGACRARRARNGEVVSDSYGKVTSLALDPIEKKPFARFMSGSRILSIGSFGCNLHCAFVRMLQFLKRVLMMFPGRKYRQKN